MKQATALMMFKASIGYDAFTPTCRDCKHRTEAPAQRQDSTENRCAAHGFHVSPRGCCNDWAGRDGSTLDTTPARPAARATRTKKPRKHHGNRAS